jgi:hypothetical protein
MEENVVPEAGLEVTLQFRQIEVRTAAAAGSSAALWVEPGESNRLAETVCRQGGRASRSGASRADAPPAWQSARRPVLPSSGAANVWCAGRRPGSCPDRRSRSPTWEKASSKSPMEDLRPGIEGVDHHLALHRAGDLDRRSSRSAGAGARQGPSRMLMVSRMKSGRSRLEGAAPARRVSSRASRKGGIGAGDRRRKRVLRRQDTGRVGRGSDDLDRSAAGAGMVSPRGGSAAGGWVNRPASDHSGRGSAAGFAYCAPAPMSTAMVRHLPC